jgi:DNA-binding MarR family transcriptional regulator
MYPSSEILVHLLTDRKDRNTIIQIAEAIGRAPSTVRSNLKVMLMHGWVERTVTTPQRHTLTDKGREVAGYRKRDSDALVRAVEVSP